MASASPTTSSSPTAADAGSDRFAAAFAARTALIPYLTAGYPSAAATPELLDGLATAGADIIELGIPFSDPLADGPTIQRAMQRALEGGASLAGALEALRGFRRRHSTPVVLFGYLNPVLAYGLERFLEDAISAGADGLLLTDLAVGSDPDLEARLEESSLALIRLVAPTTTRERAAEIARRAQGFLYYISRTGVTGARASLRGQLTQEVEILRREASVPVAVGFGISTAEQAVAVAQAADGVVIGSALIDTLDHAGAEGLVRFVGEVRRALDAARP